MTIQLSRRAVALALAAFLAFAALATVSFVRTLNPAEASHRFGDIGDTNFFHDSTAWLKDNGIADGFKDGRFYPNSHITRGQASYWFANYNDTIEIVEEPVPINSTTTSVGSGANCPAGKRTIAGGYTGPSWPWVVHESMPQVVDNSWSWQVSWSTSPAAPFSNATVWVACVPETIDKP